MEKKFPGLERPFERFFQKFTWIGFGSDHWKAFDELKYLVGNVLSMILNLKEHAEVMWGSILLSNGRPNRDIIRNLWKDDKNLLF